MKVKEGVFLPALGKTAANQVGHGIDTVMVHDRRTNAYRTGPLTNLYFFEGAIGLFFEHRFTPVVGNINKTESEVLHGVEGSVNGAPRCSLLAWKSSRTNMGALRLQELS